MKLENFLTSLFLYGGIIIALVLLFWNSIMNFIFNWIEPHPDKELYLKYEKLGRRIGKARTEKQIEALTIELHEFEINNKRIIMYHNFVLRKYFLRTIKIIIFFS